MRKGTRSAVAIAASITTLSGGLVMASAGTAEAATKNLQICWKPPPAMTTSLRSIVDGPSHKQNWLAPGSCVKRTVAPGRYDISVENEQQIFNELGAVPVTTICGPGATTYDIYTKVERERRPGYRPTTSFFFASAFDFTTTITKRSTVITHRIRCIY